MHLKDISPTPTHKLSLLEACDRLLQIRRKRAAPKIKATKPKSSAKEMLKFTKLLKKFKPDITEEQILALFTKKKEGE